jgi:hypothetical protein
MKVAELIDKLKKCPPELPVHVVDDEYGDHMPEDIEVSDFHWSGNCRWKVPGDCVRILMRNNSA